MDGDRHRDCYAQLYVVVTRWKCGLFNSASSGSGSIDATFFVIFDRDSEMTLRRMLLNVGGDQFPKHILSLESIRLCR